MVCSCEVGTYAVFRRAEIEGRNADVLPCIDRLISACDILLMKYAVRKADTKRAWIVLGEQIP